MASMASHCSLLLCHMGRGQNYGRCPVASPFPGGTWSLGQIQHMICSSGPVASHAYCTEPVSLLVRQLSRQCQWELQVTAPLEGIPFEECLDSF